MTTLSSTTIPVTQINKINIDESFMIEASAGTGKTYTIIRLFFRYLIEKNIEPQQILLVTFTKKAKEEMLTRLYELAVSILAGKTAYSNFLNLLANQSADHLKKKLEELLKNFELVNVATIHSFCLGLLEEYPVELKVPTNLKIMENEDEVFGHVFLDTVLNYPKLNSLLQDYDLNTLKNYANRFYFHSQHYKDYKLHFVVNGGYTISFSKVISGSSFSHHSKLNNLLDFMKESYFEIEKYKKKSSILTYNDMVKYVYSAITEENSKIKDILQKRYRVGIIDEFQDTDAYQWEIFKNIFLQKNGNYLVVVGDPKQSIYGFRGADVYTYLDAREDYRKRGLPVYSLNKNFRSHAVFVGDLNSVMKKVLLTHRFASKDIDYVDVEAAGHEDNKDNNESNRRSECLKNAGIEKRINFIKVELGEQEKKESGIYGVRTEIAENVLYLIKLLRSCCYQYSDIAILYRKELSVRNIKDKLLRNGIPFQDFGLDSVFDSEEALAIEYLLKFFSEPDDPRLRKRFLLYYFSFLPYFDLQVMDNHQSMLTQKIGEWQNILQEGNWYKFFYTILEDTKFYYKYFAFPDFERRITNWEHIVEILIEEATKKQLTITGLYNEYLKLKKTRKEEYLRLDSDDDKITLLSMHKSKGLEFPVVIVTGWDESRNPSVGDNDNYKYYDGIWHITFFVEKNNKNKPDVPIRNEVIQEELRLFYVAITRAREYTFVVYNADSYLLSKFQTEDYILKHNLYKIEIGPEEKESCDANNNMPETENQNGGTVKTIQEISGWIKKVSKLDYDSLRYKLHSYSSLQPDRRSSPELEDVDTDEVPAGKQDSQDLQSGKTKQDFDTFFRPGPATGSYIHKVMEIVSFDDFQKLGKEEIRKKYERSLKFYLDYFELDFSDNEKKDSVITFLLDDFLPEVLTNCKIDTFALADVDPGKMKKELGFLINDEFKKVKNNVFLTGNLDLFFEHESKFYLLDFKTTQLASYDDNNRLKEYTEKHYKIQYLLYSYALYLWLDSIGKFKTGKENRLPGKIIYFYLRGYKNQNRGIYAFDFPAFGEIKREIETILT